MYKIIGADGNEYGPVTGEQIRQWIAEGRASGQTKVQAEGGTDWQTLAGLPEFADALTVKLPPSEPLPFVTDTAESLEVLVSREYEFSLGEALGRGWELLTGNFGLVFGGTAIYLLIAMGLSGLGSIPFVGWVFSIASLIITGPLLGGLYSFLLKCVRGQPADIGEVFDGFRRAFGPLLACYLVVTLLTFLAALPGVVMMAVPIAIMAKQNAVQVLPMAFAVLGFLVVLVPAVYLQISWLYALPLIMDKGLEFWPAMCVSRRVIGKRWWPFLAFMLVCVFINLAGLCACCLGLFFTAPLTFAAMMVVYDRMFPATGASAA